MFYFLVGLVPCYAACHFLPTFFVYRFLVRLVPCYAACRSLPTFSSTVVSLLLLLSPLLPAFPWPGSLPLVLLPSPHPLRQHPRRMRGAVPNQLNLILVPPHHEPFMVPSRTPRYHFPAFFAVVVDHSADSTPNTKGASSVDPSVARNA